MFIKWRDQLKLNQDLMIQQVDVIPFCDDIYINVKMARKRISSKEVAISNNQYNSL